MVILLSGCVWPSPERQLLLDFFQACRLHDTTVLARLGTVDCNPRTVGVIQEFELVNVSRSREAPLRDVRIDAVVRSFAGGVSRQTMAVRLEERNGRWMVTGLMRLPAARTSPATSSALPK